MAGELAVTGLGAVSALGLDLDALWAGLTEGRGALAPREDLGPKHDPRCPVGTAPLATGSLRALELARRAAEAAIADAGWSEAVLRDPRTALVVATTKGTIEVLQDGLQVGLRGGPDGRMPDSLLFVLAAKLAAALDLRGPRRTVSVACASGLVAVGEAQALLASGRADRALVVGADVVGDFIYRGFSSLRALDPQGARPFDVARAGLSVGEGAAAITLEPGADGRAAVLGYGASNDANHITGPARDGRGLVAALQGALRGAPSEAREGIGFAIAHGTGTRYNDAMEAVAYRTALPSVPLTGLKGAIGHQMGAAGLINLVVAVRALEAGACPPTVGLGALDPELGVEVVQGGLRPVRAKAAVVSASGFAGVNAAVCLARGTSGARPSATDPVEVRVRGLAALEPDRASLVARVGARTARRLDDLCLFGIAAAEAALEDAGLSFEALGADPHGLVLGTALGCLESDYAFYTQALAPEGPANNPRIFAYTLPNIVLGELAIRGRLSGENLAISAGAVSGLVALEAAIARIRAGRWARALVLSVEPPGPGARHVLGADPVPRACALVLERADADGDGARVELAPPAPSSQCAPGPGWPRLLERLRAGGQEDLHVADPSGYEAHVRVRAP